ncbi:Phosphate-repressible acid phosphatase [Penicillium cinerascens]|uniref:Phosphate-repressible acid phosphatase n=1 Tax=Penicillium cinerascens TaxID=70096 RepID=A0A9W9JKD9_9EURO|nr:Phosphate-repressible acid phosphatase [Penicillium cinerascens]KAJ5198539.1 Phosphate-repressible acid phosphatase [Penicillium cinerascens]
MFTKKSLAVFIGALALAAAETTTVEYPTDAEVEEAASTVVPLSPTSNVRGLAFDRFVQVWIENTNFQTTADDANFAKLAKEGILLTNYYATTHPSEPNYCASAAGDNFGMDNDNWHQIPADISTIADLFDSRGVSWGEYMQDMPYAGYQGFVWPDSGANEYVRKHNPLVLFDSVTNSDERPRQIKNFTGFYEDLKKERLPQYMFITPNMTNDAHNSNIEVAGNFLADFIPPPPGERDTLMLVTFDETDTYDIPNRVYSFLVGGAIPEHLKGTTDDTFYTHYSTIASLSANWGLPSLGRWDCGANLLKLVAEKTGYVNWEVDVSNLFINQTYPGPLSDGTYSTYKAEWPIPATSGACSAGHGILDTVKRTYFGKEPSHDYSSPVPFDRASGINVGVKYSRTEYGFTETRITE